MLKAYTVFLYFMYFAYSEFLGGNIVFDVAAQKDTRNTEFFGYVRDPLRKLAE